MKSAKQLIRSVWSIHSRRGLSYWRYLLKGYLIPKAAYYSINGPLKLKPRKIAILGAVAFSVLTGCLGVFFDMVTDLSRALLVIVLVAMVVFVGRLIFIKLKFSQMRRFAKRLTEQTRSEHTNAPEVFTSWRKLPVSDDVRDAVENARRLTPQQELVIGHIDNDGRLLGLFGEIPGLPFVNKAGFLQRKRFKLDVVLIEDRLLVRKDYKAEEREFLSEWLTLALVSRKTNVPAIHHVDEQNLRIYKNLIIGKTIRELLVDAGAKIMHAQTQEDKELVGLDITARLETIVSRGTSLVSAVLKETVLSEIEHQINLIHNEGVTNFSSTFGNIVIDSENGAPWFIDFDSAVAHRSTSSLEFIFRRDVDRVKFNRRYQRNVLTESSARVALGALTARHPGWYSPIDFGYGLTIGGFWSTDSGTGRWQFLNEKIMASTVKGKRVLDLGSNNGLMPLMMLRAGAREVVGVELSHTNVEAAKVIQKLFEWRDMRSYDLHIHNGDMRDVLTADWGKFDVVTALCSLYYLDPDEMASIVRKAAELAPVMIIQANIATRREAAEGKSEKSSIQFLTQLLDDNGYPSVELHAPVNFSRPILIGRSRQRDSNSETGLVARDFLKTSCSGYENQISRPPASESAGLYQV